MGVEAETMFHAEGVRLFGAVSVLKRFDTARVSFFVVWEGFSKCSPGFGGSGKVTPFIVEKLC